MRRRQRRIKCGDKDVRRGGQRGRPHERILMRWRRGMREEEVEKEEGGGGEGNEGKGGGEEEEEKRVRIERKWVELVQLM